MSSFTRANGEPPPEKARRRVNAICASVPVRAVLTPEGRAVEEPDARDTYALFESTVSRSAVELAYRDEDRLSVCGAPEVIRPSEVDEPVTLEKVCVDPN